MNHLAQSPKAQGDLAGARALEEKPLEILRRVLGEEHPDTIGSAWNLFATSLLEQDSKGAALLLSTTALGSRPQMDEARLPAS